MLHRFFGLLLLLILLWAPHICPAAESTTTLAHGKSLLESRQYSSAYQEFLVLFKNDPGNSEKNFYLGVAAVGIKDYESAVMAFDRVLIADPDAIQAKIELAKSFYKLGAYETAKRYFTEVLESNAPVDIKKSIKKFMATIP